MDGSSDAKTTIDNVQSLELLDDNSVVVGASGSLPGDLQRMWISKTSNTYHMEYGYSCIGYEIAGAWFSSFLTSKPLEETLKAFKAHRDFLHERGAKVIEVSEQRQLRLITLI